VADLRVPEHQFLVGQVFPAHREQFTDPRAGDEQRRITARSFPRQAAIRRVCSSGVRFPHSSAFVNVGFSVGAAPSACLLGPSPARRTPQGGILRARGRGGFPPLPSCRCFSAF
jgi:hypothetical protein